MSHVDGLIIEEDSEACDHVSKAAATQQQLRLNTKKVNSSQIDQARHPYTRRTSVSVSSQLNQALQHTVSISPLHTIVWHCKSSLYDLMVCRLVIPSKRSVCRAMQC
jgi:hypothetical protein